MIEVAPGVRGFAVRSPTLPPATHTNVWMLGDTQITVFDPASPWPVEQRALLEALKRLHKPVERIVLTHHHHDHVSGAVALQQVFQVPIYAHSATAARLPFPVQVLNDEVLRCGTQPVRVIHTPGHAPGHLAFVHEPTGSCVAGDMVAGVGTIGIDTDDDGHLGTYLASLEQLRALDCTVLLPAHGPTLDDPQEVLTHYLDHRHDRSEQIRSALQHASTPIELAPHVYKALAPRFYPLAAMQIRSHLIWLEEQGEVSLEQGQWQRASEVRPPAG